MRRRILKTTAIFLALNILTEIIAPGVAYALTDGPASPEFSSFEPVATTDMVSLFSGDFTYNLPALDIPGPDGAGYSMSLSYHSGTSMEEEASWVGYGWTLNPGAINRNTRGFPDDYNGAKVQYYNKTRPNWSAGSTADVGIEFFSKDSKSTFGLSASASLRFNNYNGFQRSYGLGLDVMGMVNLGANYSAEGVTYSAQVNPAGILNKFKKDSKDQNQNTKAATSDRKKLRAERYSEGLKQRAMGAVSSGVGSAYGLFSFNELSRATGLTKYSGSSFNFSKSLQVNAYLPVGLQIGIAGNFNMQYNEPTSEKPVYGFMNNKADQGTAGMGDYYVEKGNSYSKRDYFLGIPFNNADNFTVSGEGVGGGFRFYPSKNGHFYPEQIESRTTSFQAGVELMVGWNLGVGVDLGVGLQKLKMQYWPNQGNTTTHKYDTPGGILRFNNDLGGEVEYSTNIGAESVSVSQVGNFPGFKGASAAMPTSGTPQTINRALNGASAAATTPGPAGRSSFVDYKTNQTLSTTPAEAYNKTVNISDLIYRNSPPAYMQSGIAEISVHNEDGMQHIYGLPTYTRNEANLQFDIKQNKEIYDNYLVYQDIAFTGNPYTPDLSKHVTVVGDVKKEAPYANNYLLTQILTPEYVDVTNNGVSDDDFGGWTQFNYHKKIYDGTDQWYRYRTPYTGLLYQKNGISDTKDDVGSVMSGEKEVYYLKSVETKTHIAFFVTNKSTPSRYPTGYTATHLTGSNQSRLDARGASKQLNGSNMEEAARNKSNTRGAEELEYLEKIVLFSKARKDKPLQITRFAYNYDLVGNLPNNENGKFPESKTSLQSGKLTLSKMWFEYEGVINSKISPYVFKYEYKDKDELTALGEGHLLTKYPQFAELLGKYSKESQNPDYAPHLLDPWGNTQNFGQQQQLKDRPWIYQGPDNTTGAKTFDPAAWQLKQIKLPSGGEILVEYEQKDYRYVQDRSAMAMASLVSYDDSYGEPGTNPSYVVNVSDLNITTRDDRDKLMAKITEHFGSTGEKEKIFFKFLYALKGNIASLDFCKSEYVDGYAQFASVEAVDPASNTNLNIRIRLKAEKIKGTTTSRNNSPRQACYDLVANQRLGKVDDTGQDCSTSYEDQYDGIVRAIAEGTGPDKITLKLSLVPSVIKKMNGDLASSKYKIPDRGSVCVVMNEGLSYLKLPMLHAKKGGGIRVKRLYMLDHGLEATVDNNIGDAALYGTEYVYETEDHMSSGVATNEPPSVRVENPLVTFMPKKSQSWFSKLTAGEEKDQTEGPLGESLLPGASVGHSRVVVKNIHEGPTGSGFSIQEFFTAKDYPFDKFYGNNPDSEVSGKSIQFTNLDDNKVTDHVKIPAVFFNYSVDKVWAAQGFRFIINNMHGQVKKISTYGGDYKDFDLNRVYLASLQEYTYFEPGEKVKVLNPNGTYTMETPGKEMDMAMEMKSLQDNTMDFSIEMDISITISIWPPVFFSFWPSFQLSDNRMSTHMMTKVVRYPAIVKSVLNYKDGAYDYTENLAFNGANGKPILVKSADEYDKVKMGTAVHDGSLYTLSVPASWKYGAMGQKALNINNTNQLNATTGTFVTYGTEGNLITSSTAWTSSLTASKNILAADVQTFTNSGVTGNAVIDGWYGADVQADFPGIPAAEAKLDKIWRPFEAYTYRADVKSSNGAVGSEDKAYRGGVFKNFTMYNWATTAQTDANWIRTTQVTKYSPNGLPLEEMDVLGIRTSAKYDYSFGNSKNLLPVIISKNAEYKSIAFNGFETNGDADIGHSGSKSIQYSFPSIEILKGLSASAQLRNKGGLLKLWLKSTYSTGPAQPEAIINSKNIKMDKIAQTGEWALFSAVIDKSVFPALNAAFTVQLTYAGRPLESVYIDDVRFQPFDADSKCYVYDVRSFKLLAEFDDQHFGLFYQYSAEGKLVRKQVETERGLKTIQETQYNTPKTIPLQ